VGLLNNPLVVLQGIGAALGALTIAWIISSCLLIRKNVQSIRYEGEILEKVMGVIEDKALKEKILDKLKEDYKPQDSDSTTNIGSIVILLAVCALLLKVIL
jgi:hypothetical protein